MVLRITLTPQGVARLKETTSNHVGDRLALPLDSRLLRAPKIVEGVAGSDFTVGVELPKGGAERVAASIAARWQQG